MGIAHLIIAKREKAQLDKKPPLTDAEMQRRYYDKNKERLISYRLKWARNNKDSRKKSNSKWNNNNRDYFSNYHSSDLPRYLWTSYYNRAKKNNIDFDIDPNDIFVPEFCPVLGIKLERSNIAFDGCSPSVDRIDNTKGYIKGNIEVISMRANKLKSDGTLEEFKALVRHLEGKL